MPHKDREARRKYMREWSRKPESKIKARIRQQLPQNKIKQKFNRIKYIYGIGKEEYLRLVSETGGMCRICGGELIFKRLKPNSAVVDHCHKSGKVRGVICHKCNVILGNSNDSVEVLENAIVYLKSHK